MIAVLAVIVWISTAYPVMAASGINVQYNAFFVPSRNEYRVDYWGLPSNVNRVHLHFESPIGDIHDRYFDRVTGIMMLTCRGTYDLIFLDGSQEVAWIYGINTYSISAGSCLSYEDGGARRDFDTTVTPNAPNGPWTVNWPPVPGADRYDIHRNGQYVDTTTGTTTTITQPGSYTVVARGPNGEVIGETDFTIIEGGGSNPGGSDPGSGDPGGGDPGGGGCSVCDKIDELLTCPGWDQLLADLDGIIPDPPDWEYVADLIGAATIRHLQNYFGPVPPAPSQAEIDAGTQAPIPQLDTDTGAEHLVPDVPDEYDAGPMDFDITTGPQIDIKDESQPFLLHDPLYNVPHDAPGVPVYPGDPRNSSNGIKTPDSPTQVYPGVPVPAPGVPGGIELPDQGQPQPVPPDGPDIPHDPMPVPDITDGIIPIPRVDEGGGM